MAAMALTFLTTWVSEVCGTAERGQSVQKDAPIAPGLK
jgi:hypothetical protein